MHIQLTEMEIAFLERAARRPSQLEADSHGSDAAVIELLLAMQLIVCRDDMLEITILGQHLLKFARTLPRED